MKNKFVLGLDLGIGSVGWSCMLQNEEGKFERILDLGVRIFDSGEDTKDKNEKRRAARGTRRLIARRVNRKNDLRKIFIENNILTDQELNNIFNQKNILLPSPYFVKVKGLEQQLTKKELFIALLHYVKHRGYKSNRKIDENAAAKRADEDGRALQAKSITADKVKELECSISQYLVYKMLSAPELIDKFQINQNKMAAKSILSTIEECGIGLNPFSRTNVHNKDSNFEVLATREMTVEEAIKLLDKQIEFGLISQAFKNEYLEILQRQRSFAMGPGRCDKDSPYHNPLKKMIGVARDGNKRAPLNSYSYEKFNIITKLQNLTFDSSNQKSLRLDSKQINDLVHIAEGGKVITYGVVKDYLNLEEIRFKGLELTYSERKKLLDDLSKKGIQDYYEKTKYFEKAKFAKEIASFKFCKEVKKTLKEAIQKTDLQPKQYDDIGWILSTCKSDEEIANEGKRLQLDEKIIEVIKNKMTARVTKFGRFSFEMLNELLPLLEEGKNLYEALKEKGMDDVVEKLETNLESMPPVPELLERLNRTITNHSVMKILSETRRVVNAIVKLYGYPSEIHIEVGREVAKSKQEKNEIMDRQFINQTDNLAIKYKIVSLDPQQFVNISHVKGKDIEKYKLFIEQKGLCLYTLAETGNEDQAKIKEKEIFTSKYEIDHIIPYTRSLDDRISNKTLVKTEMNRNKLNCLPFEKFSHSAGWNKFKHFILNNHKISDAKKKGYLLEKLTPDILDDFRSRDLQDTKYATITAKTLIEYCFPNVKVKSFNGDMTGKLRGIWGLNGLTHSLQSKDYKLDVSDEIRKKVDREGNDLDQMLEKLYEMHEKYLDDRNNKEIRSEYYKYKSEVEKKYRELDSIKNRDNYLHHALDATLIAVFSSSLYFSFQEYCKYQYIKNLKDRTKFQEKRTILNKDTGEVEDKKFIEMNKEDYLKEFDYTIIDQKSRFKTPYSDFVEEVKCRIYEQDEEELANKLSYLSNYKVADIASIKPIMISHDISHKMKGRLHEETFKGKHVDNGKEYLKERIKVSSSKFTRETLEKLINKDTTSKLTYEIIAAWIDGYKSGEEAFMVKGLPINGNKNVISKVTILSAAVKEQILLRSDLNQYVEKENVLRIDVYRKIGDNKIYYVGLDKYRIVHENKKSIDYLLWCGAGKYTKIDSLSIASQGFYKVLTLYKNDIAELELKKGNKGICKIIGLSSGVLEVTSILGDNYDLKNYGFVQKLDQRCRIYVTQIMNIKIISMSVLGKINNGGKASLHQQCDKVVAQK